MYCFNGTFEARQKVPERRKFSHLCIEDRLCWGDTPEVTSHRVFGRRHIPFHSCLLHDVTLSERRDQGNKEIVRYHTHKKNMLVKYMAKRVAQKKKSATVEFLTTFALRRRCCTPTDRQIAVTSIGTLVNSESGQQ